MPFFFSPTSVALAEDWGSYLLADQSKERYHRARYHPISARYRVLGVVPCPLFRLVRACLPGTGLSKTLPPRYQAWGEAPLRARKGLVPPSDTDTLVGAGRAPSSLSASVGRGPLGPMTTLCSRLLISRAAGIASARCEAALVLCCMP